MCILYFVLWCILWLYFTHQQSSNMSWQMRMSKSSSSSFFSGIFLWYFLLFFCYFSFVFFRCDLLTPTLVSGSVSEWVMTSVMFSDFEDIYQQKYLVFEIKGLGTSQPLESEVWWISEQVRFWKTVQKNVDKWFSQLDADIRKVSQTSWSNTTSLSPAKQKFKRP